MNKVACEVLKQKPACPAQIFAHMEKLPKLGAGSEKFEIG